MSVAVFWQLALGKLIENSPHWSPHRKVRRAHNLQAEQAGMLFTLEQKSLQHVTLQCKSAWLRTKPFRHSKPTYMYAKICIHATPQAPVSAQHELDIYITMILRRPLRTDADTDADPRGEVFGPRYDSNMLTLVGVYQYIYIYISLSPSPH